MIKGLAIAALILLLLPVVGLGFLSWISKKPDNLGPTSAGLGDCPRTPNCVSSQAKDKLHQIDAIPLEGSAADGLRKVKMAILAQPRTAIVKETANYLHAEATSAIFRFIDDVEVYVDEPGKQIQLRSASRIGRSDMGVNRKRIDDIRRAYLSHE